MKSGAYSSGNRLLDALPRHDRTGLEADLEIVTLAAHQFTHSVGGGSVPMEQNATSGQQADAQQ